MKQRVAATALLSPRHFRDPYIVTRIPERLSSCWHKFICERVQLKGHHVETSVGVEGKARFLQQLKIQIVGCWITNFPMHPTKQTDMPDMRSFQEALE